jgi:hypothetical protein
VIYLRPKLRSVVLWEGGVSHRKKEKYLFLFLFVLFISVGAYLLEDSIRNTGQYAEETAIAGALLSALALAAVAWSIRVHLQGKALRRHLRTR